MLVIMSPNPVDNAAKYALSLMASKEMVSNVPFSGLVIEQIDVAIQKRMLIMLNQNLTTKISVSVSLVSAYPAMQHPAKTTDQISISWHATLTELRAYRTQIYRALQMAAHLDEASTEADIEPLNALLNDPEPFVREAAARPLARLQGVMALPALLYAMRECERAGTPSRPLSNVAAQLVRTHPAEMQSILQQMQNDSDSDTRKDAAWSYGFLDESVAQAPLLLALRDSEVTVRIAAANAMRSFSSPAILAALCHSLFDPIEQVRVAVAATLSQIATSDSIPALSRAQYDSSQAVRVFVNYTLKRLGVSESPPVTTTTFIQRATSRTLQKIFARA